METSQIGDVTASINRHLTQLDLRLRYHGATVYSLAAQRNSYRLFQDLALFLEQGERETSSAPVRNLSIRLESEQEFIEPTTWEIASLSPGQHIRLPEKTLNLPDEYLYNLTDEVTLKFRFILSSHDQEGERELATHYITLLPANFWGGESRQPELLAAFVKPNGQYVESLVRQATELMDKNGHGRAADGYQSGTREKPYVMAMALWNAIVAQKLAYVSPPPSYAHDGQLVRLPSEISTQKIAACLDLSLLFSSCLELMGLNPVIALLEGHALVGAWLIDSSFPLLTNDDPQDLRKRVDSRDIVLFETTLVTNSSPVSFLEAAARGRELIEEGKEGSFVYVIDVAQARSRRIKPLSTVEQRREEEAAAEVSLDILPPPPPLPKVSTEERVEEETPETRVDMWQRKLLDLSKRNSLLNFSDRARAVRLYCPDLGKLEDLLADGIAFDFQSAERSPINDSERSAENFRLTTGNDLHKTYAIDQLDKRNIVANMTQKKLENSLVELLRKSKSDLEEGGANTLFLALGMLKWQEVPGDTKSYKAPLILLPVELTRKSARASIKIRQLVDNDPIFNLTLIEFLLNEHAIDLRQFKDDLPEDSSGVDVGLVWQTVREAVNEQPGFEVVEESALASFSFAKYVMWNDLRTRLDDLRRNAFVSHMVDTPNEAYQQDSSFIEREKVDERIDPNTVFTPLNCDSSQLVAVEASGRAQDFVLEGPPGTGKSETIANIIAHNIAIGRKVLFVAEKIAALQVVYRRIEKIGLDHLCLELHSSKANKKAVLDQLARAVSKVESGHNDNWKDAAALLKKRRDKLNNYVQALHKPSPFQITPRQAIARWAKYRDRHELDLGWSWDFEGAPINDKAGLQRLLEAGQQLITAFEGIESVDATPFLVVQSVEWSNAWQTRCLDLLKEAEPIINRLQTASRGLAENFTTPLEGITQQTLKSVGALAKLVRIAQDHSIEYVVGGDAKSRLGRLADLAEAKSKADEILKKVAHSATAEKVLAAPIDEWLGWQQEAENSFFKRLFLRGKINKAAAPLGFERFQDLGVLTDIKAARETLEITQQRSKEFQEAGIWSGWETDPAFLNDRFVSGERARQCIGDALSLVDDTVELMMSLRKHLVDARDFIDTSKVANNTAQFEQAKDDYDTLIKRLAEFGVVAPEDMTLAELGTSLSQVVENGQKLKAWVNWVSAKREASELCLNALSTGLESGRIPVAEASDQLLTAFCAWLAPRLIDADEHLLGFDSISHENLIETFRKLDSDLASITSDYIRIQAANNAPDINNRENAPHFSTLAKELQKKTRHKPIRVLFEDMGERVLDLCPVMMMSPLSVAQFLPSNFSAFDLVVFDEASQITPWDAVGAIARGKNVIVVGDPKQMPPTNFFNKTVDADNPDEEDLESILDQALAARLPHLRLLGHYRSRHETLIAFSNSRYYDNSLITYPSSSTKSSAVTLHKVDGVYAKGKGRNNVIEAKAVATEVVRRLLHPELSQLSIGVVTLNSEQQRTVEDFLDEARRKHPEVEQYFHGNDEYDPVFVKNLESVQGDERDVIMLSVGYGPTTAGGRTMSMNFGPLNKAGGERRLNVAITRATSEVCVFASFDHSMIDLSRTSAVAVEHLKHYLEYAEHGPMVLPEQATAEYGVDQFDSDFEEAVAWSLRDLGWKVQTQVGVSKFRVDLGIIHPDYPGVYLAGVECDGATYHGSPSARDRDRVRHSVLESLGWKLLRIWSTEYFTDPDEVIRRIHSKLEEILSEDRAKQRDRSIHGGEENFDIDWGGSEGTDHTDSAATASSDDYEESDSDRDEEDSGSCARAERVEYDANKYYDPSERPNLERLSRAILAEQPCITLKDLALQVAGAYGRSRTSAKQRDHLLEVIKPWAGISGPYNGQWVMWPSPNDIRNEIPWRGVEPFGGERKWNEIAYPEALGLARKALAESPHDPVGYICDVFNLQRHYDSTLREFRAWVDAIRSQTERPAH
jgi:very-short-patch-repair endonuclease